MSSLPFQQVPSEEHEGGLDVPIVDDDNLISEANVEGSAIIEELQSIPTQWESIAMRTSSPIALRANIVLPSSDDDESRMLPNISLMPYPAGHGSGAQLRSTDEAPQGLVLTSPPRGRSPPELLTRPPSPASVNSAEGLVTMGTVTNIASRINAIERALVERAQQDQENTRDKRALQSEVRVLGVTMSDVNERVTAIQAKNDEHTAFISTVTEKLDSIMVILMRVSNGNGTESFEISTPQSQPAQGPLETHRPAQINRSAHFGNSVAEPGNSRPVDMPMPRFNGIGDSPAPYPSSPPMVSFVDNGTVDPWAAASQYRQRAPEPTPTEDRDAGSMWGKGRPIMTWQNFKICQKPNQRLFQFDGMMINYKLWRNRMNDHLCNRSSRRYESLLVNIEKTEDSISKVKLMNTTVDGVNAWEVAEELEGFVFDFVCPDLYDRRNQLTNFEAGNGFEAWRQLHLEFAGGGPIANVGGFKRIQEYPRCEDLKKLEKHLADWEELISKYGSNLLKCPEELRTMTLGVVPRSVEDELIHKDQEYPTWRHVISYCRKRTRQLQHRAYADLVRHPRAPNVKGYVNHLGSQGPAVSDADVPVTPTTVTENERPAWVGDLINAVTAMKRAPPPPAPNGARVARPKAKAKAGARARTPGPKFIFGNGCWQCGEADHQRHECAEWKRIAPSGVPPAGHKGARDKAYERFKANRDKARVNNFEGEEDDEAFEDELEEYDPMNYSFIDHGTKWEEAQYVPPSMSDQASLNSFGALDDGRPDSATSMADSLNQWAHVVIDAKQPKTQKAKRAALQKARKQNVRQWITTAEELAAAIKALPGDFKSLAQIARNRPDDRLLGPGEIWVMLDTGANVDAAKIAEHFPEYLNYVEALDTGNNGGAECASGKVVKCRGRAHVKGLLGGQQTTIPFRDMDIKMPIASMKKRVEGADGFDVFITDGGAMMRHRKTGQLVQMYDRGGVYFSKFQTQLPDGLPHKPKSPFHRLG